MTVVISASGKTEAFAQKLTSTSDVVIVTADANKILTIESLRACCNATATDFFLWLDTGADDVYLINGKQIATKSYEDLKDHQVPLKPGWALKCKAGAANNIDVTAVISVASPSSGQGK